jgi:hypothetical protein
MIVCGVFAALFESGWGAVEWRRQIFAAALIMTVERG